MRTLAKTLTLAVLLVAFIMPAQGQVLIDDANSVAAFEATPVTQVEATQLQHIIMLASKSTTNLKSSAAHLYRVAREHPNAGTRVMAITALHAVGNEAEMFKLLRDVDEESSPQVRATMIRVLNDFFDGRYKKDDPRFVHGALLNGQ